MSATTWTETSRRLATVVLVVLCLLAVPAVALWHPLGIADTLLIAAMGVFGLLGQAFLTLAFSRAPAALVAPFAYLQLVWAVAVDLLVFGALPGPGTWAGAALVIGSGLLLFALTLRRRGFGRSA